MTIVDANGEQTIDLAEGDNSEIYTGTISGNDSDDGIGYVTLRLSGRVEDGSNKYWRSGDLSVTITYDFKHEADEE